MQSVRLLPYYVVWHYTKALADLVSVYVNFLWFFLNFFSIPTLLATFVAPFQRLEEGYGKGFDVEAFFSALIVNLLMRVVGMGVRSIVIVLGIVVLLATLLAGVVFFVLWLILPLAVVALFMSGMALILFPL